MISPAACIKFYSLRSWIRYDGLRVRTVQRPEVQWIRLRMATPRDLRSQPITEALVDIRGTANASQETFVALGREFAAQYPQLKIMRKVRAELKIVEGKLIPPEPEDLGLEGVHLLSEDGSGVVQLRTDGFTFNNLNVYMGGDRLLATALGIWERFRSLLDPPVVPRVALRYINRFALPLREGEELKKFLTAPPELPDGAPQRVSEFLSRIVAHEPDANATVVVSQRLSAPSGERVDMVIDVDAIIERDLRADSADVRPALDQLRRLKNLTFFSLLTDKAVALFL